MVNLTEIANLILLQNKISYNKAIADFEEKLLYQIGDLGVRDIIMETAMELKEN